MSETGEMVPAGQAARRLGISLDTLRRWDRQGRIAVTRDRANRRVVAASEIARLLGTPDRAELSARNRLRGTLRSIEIDGLLARIELEVTTPGRVVAIVTREAVEELGLRVGADAAAVVKATSVMIERA